MTKIPRGQTPERAAYMKAWNAANPRDRRAYKKAYDEAHRERDAEYRAANRERFRARAAAHYDANRERIVARAKAYYEANRERVLEYHVAYNVANAEKLSAAAAAWRKANPERRQHIENRRRARKKNNGGSHTLEELIDKFASLGNVCFYCGSGGKLTVDHDLPLSRGGTDNIENILPACRSCNSKKNNKTASEFAAVRTNHTLTGGVGAKLEQKYTGR